MEWQNKRKQESGVRKQEKLFPKIQMVLEALELSPPLAALSLDKTPSPNRSRSERQLLASALKTGLSD